MGSAFTLLAMISAPVSQRCVGVSAEVSLIPGIPDYLKPRTRPITKPEPRSHAAAIFVIFATPRRLLLVRLDVLGPHQRKLATYIAFPSDACFV